MTYTIKYANMHLHSTHSDGQYSPHHLAVMAKALGYGGVVLSDHDVISGVPELMRVAKIIGIESMTGVEFGCRQWDVGFHILGYDFDLEDPDMKKFVKVLCKYRNDHTRALFEAGLKRGTLKDITWEEVLKYNPKNEWFCNDQIENAMVAKGIILKDEWESIRKINFSTLSPHMIPIEEPSVEDAVKHIKKAGGISILAHPANKFEYVDGLLEIGIQGIEVCHPTFDGKEEEEIMFREKADKCNLYKTGGTDHTGPMGGCLSRHDRPLAFHGAGEDDFKAIKERRFG
jgi:predicted metal-dependent phosphoesterase TrpH